MAAAKPQAPAPITKTSMSLCMRSDASLHPD